MDCSTYWGAVLLCDVYKALRRIPLEDVSFILHSSPLLSLPSSLLVTDQYLNARVSPLDKHATASRVTRSVIRRISK